MRSRYTAQELDDAALEDQMRDAENSELQAEFGPYYPERGITRESLLAYAKKCRAFVDRYANGGAHKAILEGSAA